jgi:hypothetical protein
MSLLDNYILTLDQAQPGSGPLAPAIDNRLSPRSETYLSLDHNIRTKIDNNFIPIINAQNESSQQYVNDKYVNFTGREQISPTVVEQIALKGDNIWNNLSYNNIPEQNYLAARTTTNETTHFSYAGNAEREDQGSKFWTYKDAPRTTTNETTLFSYSGNAEREDQGSKFWTYKDAPRTTTNETTLYSYSGDAAGTVSSHNQTNRVQFTGTTEYFIDENGKECEYKSSNSGVTNWGSKSATLVQDYFPGSNGAMNIQLDPDEKLGYTLMKADWDLVNANGAGTYSQAIPNATMFSQVSKDFIGEVRINPNLQFGIDDRQTAIYQITNLRENGLSIYQDPKLRHNDNTIPTFFINPNASNYSGIATKPVQYEELKEWITPPNIVSVYNNNSFNPNEVITKNTYGQSNSNIENPLLYQNRVPDNTAHFFGKGYPGTALQGNKSGILLDTDSSESSRYLHKFSPNGCLNSCVY